MPMSSIQPNPDPPVADWPLYRFARLEKAVEQGAHQAAAEAQQQLARLGVRVCYGRPHQTVHTVEGKGVPDVG